MKFHPVHFIMVSISEDLVWHFHTSSVSLLNIWVVIIGILISSFANYNTCVQLWSVLMTDFSLRYGLYFPTSLNVWSCFYWMPDVMNFNLMGSGYLYLSHKYCEFCSRMKLTYLETVCFFKSHFSDLSNGTTDAFVMGHSVTRSFQVLYAVPRE